MTVGGPRIQHIRFPFRWLALAVAEHEHARIEPWLWGLLPDNEAILARWGQRFHVSSSNAFRLLAAVGEDCPGAIQLARTTGQDGWLTEADIAKRLSILRQDQAAWRMVHDVGQFNLAGAKPKTALLFDDFTSIAVNIIHLPGMSIHALDAREAEWPEAVAAIRLLVLTGCRRIEVLNLRWRNIGDDSLNLEDSKTGPRAVPLEAVRKHIAALPGTRDPGKFLFPRPAEGRCAHGFAARWRMVCEDASLGRLRLHDVRHTAASLAVKSGENLPLVGKLLGHRRLSLAR